MSKLAHANCKTMQSIERRAAFDEGNEDYYQANVRDGMDRFFRLRAKQRNSVTEYEKGVKAGFELGFASGMIIGLLAVLIILFKGIAQ